MENSLNLYVIPFTDDDKKICHYLKQNICNENIYNIKDDLCFLDLNPETFNPLKSILIIPVGILTSVSDQITDNLQKKIGEFGKSHQYTDFCPLFIIKDGKQFVDKVNLPEMSLVIYSEENEDVANYPIFEYFLEALPKIWTYGGLRGKLSGILTLGLLIQDFTELIDVLSQELEDKKIRLLVPQNIRELNIKGLIEILPEEKSQLQKKFDIEKPVERFSFSFLSSYENFMDIPDKEIKKEIDALLTPVANKIFENFKDKIDYEKKKTPSYEKIEKEFTKVIPDEIRAEKYTLKDIEEYLIKTVSEVEGALKKSGPLNFWEWFNEKLSYFFNFCLNYKKELKNKYDAFKKARLSGWKVYLFFGILLFLFSFRYFWKLPFGSIPFRIFLNIFTVSAIVIGGRFYIVRRLFKKVLDFWKMAKEEIEKKPKYIIQGIPGLLIDDIVMYWENKNLQKLDEFSRNCLTKLQKIEDFLSGVGENVDSCYSDLTKRRKTKFMFETTDAKIDVSETAKEQLKKCIWDIICDFSRLESVSEISERISITIKKELLPLCEIKGDVSDQVERLAEYLTREQKGEILYLLKPVEVQCKCYSAKVVPFDWQRKDALLLFKISGVENLTENQKGESL